LLGRRIGAGGMAAVFAARQQGPRGIGRLVAVKVMSTAIADDPAFQRMFLRELTIATRLEHRNVVRVYEVGEDGGDFYLAMELVNGASLAAILRDSTGPVPTAIALRIATEVARGLHAAHELTDAEGRPLGLVHQDVTPQNVMVAYDGTVKLLDFGVARLGAVDASRTETIRGKPSYLAPEQVSMGHIDRRTDVFALGIVVFEILVGRKLFGGDSLHAKCLAVLDGTIPDVRSVAPHVPAAVAEVVDRALSRDPAQRFQNADEMRRALAAAGVTAGLPELDESEVAAWASATVPPGWTAAELEREILDGAPPESVRTARPDLSDLSTVAEPGQARPPGQGDNGVEPGARATSATANDGASTTPPRARRSIAVALAIAAVSSAGVVYWLRSDAETPSAPGAAQAPGDPSEAQSALQPPSPAEATVAPEPSSATMPSAAPSVAAAPSPPRADSLGTTPKPVALPPTAASASTVVPGTSSADVEASKAFVSVGSNVSGRVTVDGVPVGDSPIPKLPVVPGTHTVKVHTATGAQTQSVTVAPGQHAKVKFVF
jgi:serine/threonine-protein kinase